MCRVSCRAAQIKKSCRPSLLCERVRQLLLVVIPPAVRQHARIAAGELKVPPSVRGPASRRSRARRRRHGRTDVELVLRDSRRRGLCPPARSTHVRRRSYQATSRIAATGLRVPLSIGWGFSAGSQAASPMESSATSSWLQVGCAEASARMSFQRPQQTQPRFDRASPSRSLRQLTVPGPGR